MFTGFLFLIELRYPFYGDLGEGSGAGPIPFSMVVDASVMGKLFPEIQREAIASTLKAISGSKVTKQ